MIDTPSNSPDRPPSSTSRDVQDFLEQIPVPSLTIDLDGVITHANGRFLRYINISAQHVSGVSVNDLFTDQPDLSKRVEAAFTKVRSGGTVEEEAVAIRGLDGAHLLAAMFVYPLRNVEGALAGFRLALVDQTAEQQAHQRFKDLFDNAMLGLYRTTPEGKVLLANPTVIQMLGYDNFDDLAQLDLTKADFYVEVPRSEFEEAIQRDGEVRGFESVWRRKDGTLLYVRESARAIRDDSGKVLYYEGTVEDVTQRVRTEQALRDNEQQLRYLYDNTPVMMHSIDMAGRLLNVNAFWLRTLGYERDEVIGRRSVEFLTPASHRYAKMILPLLDRHGALKDIELQFMKKDGDAIETLLSAVKVPPRTEGNAESTDLFALAFIIDNTDRKRAEEQRLHLDAQIQHAQKLESLGVLAGGIAHDFNNLLMGMLGNASLALMELPPSSPVRGPLQQIEKTSQRAAELCKQLLAYSGKGRFVVQTIDLSELVQDMNYLMEMTIANRASLRLNLADKPPPIDADATQIRQILMNLLLNAAEAMEEKGGAIAINTGVRVCDRDYLKEMYLDDELPGGEYVFLEVADSGCGMDKSTLAKIFDPFFTTKFTGRGLGMAAVLGIVRGHHGAIKIYSEPKHGTTVKILFPTSREHVSEEAKAAPALSESLGGGTALIIDDEEAVRAVASRILEYINMKVYTAEDGQDGVDMFKQHADEIDIVLLDMTMPKLSGEEVFREIRRIRPDVAVLLSSGYNEQDATAHFAGKGLAGFIQKPYSPRDLIQMIETILEGRE
ncbi:MAG: PAS domain S-box protein [Candidatus Hydrogenedentes bacterium]|nr:PAS domain S-box protein [Candidatus Hydrogenedentota bacterium]